MLERTLPFEESPCGMHYYLQFPTGAIIDHDFGGPGGPSTQSEVEAWRAKRSDIDAAALQLEGGLQLISFGCVFVAVDEQDWDDLSAGQIVSKLRFAQWLTGTTEIRNKDFPATYLFRTARGDSGVLQVTGVTENPRAVKMRYKLILLNGNSGYLEELPGLREVANELGLNEMLASFAAGRDEQIASAASALLTRLGASNHASEARRAKTRTK